jgi:universal stress protein A
MMTRRIRRILHPSDFSPASRAAFSRAVDVAKRHAAELLVMHVLAPVPVLVPGGYLMPQTYNQVERSMRMTAQKGMNALVTRARKARLRARGLLVLGALPHVEIVKTARSKRIDMIVMGTHGRSGLAKLFLGSVAERVIATAPCPVLTVRQGRTR